MDSIDGFKIPYQLGQDLNLPLLWPIDRSTSRPEKTLSETLRFIAEKNALNNEACDGSSSRDQ